MNQLAYSQKILTEDKKCYRIVHLSCNTFQKCEWMTGSDYKQVIGCLMAVIDSVYIEALARVRQDQDFDTSSLELLLKTQIHLLQGLSYKAGLLMGKDIDHRGIQLNPF